MTYIIFIIIFLSFTFLISFLFAKLISYVVQKIFNPKFQNLKILNLIFSGSIFLLLIAYFLYNSAKNFETAYIEKSGNTYIITLKGKRNLMVHDPISLMKKGTYIDSIKFVIPQAEGTVEGKNILNEKNLQDNNALIIQKNKLEVNIFYFNSKKSSWNGKYKLVKRNF